ncbi:TB2/DP1, HVA22 family-domain-containing protein [Gorgonomyces haynaldii]|nr:TB2/DP1, HVA22 family-domain-containing protein [Gorgonomyces haynaldii]
MASIPQKLQEFLDKQLSQVAVMNEFEKKTQIPKTYAVLGVGGVFLTLIFFNIWGNLLVNLVGFVYPCYASFKAIESSDTRDDIQWLTYWVVFGFFNTIEFFSDVLIYWIPLYYTIKTLVGASVVYKEVLRPLLVRNENKIDTAFSNLKKKVTDELKKD